MARRPMRRAALVNLVSLAVVLVACLFVLLRQADQNDEGRAYAAAPVGQKAGTGDDAAAALQRADAGDEAGLAASTSPIDLAAAPDGGVPRHQEGTTPYRSPFAKPNAGPAVRMKVGMLLNSVDNYDIKTGMFAADFFLSLTSALPMPDLNLQFPNGKLENKETLADKPTFKMFRLLGQFKSPPDLRKYPYDSQDLKIVVEDDTRGIDQIRFSPDKERTQLARGFRALGWRVSYLEARALSESYPDRFDGDDLYYGRYIFTVRLERFATSAAFKVFVPAFVIVIIALLGMWVPPANIDVRSNSGAPMLAGAVLFHYALMQELPATSYLTRADKLMLGVYVSLALGMISTWWMFLVKEENQMTVFRVSRILVPILTAGAMALACLD